MKRLLFTLIAFVCLTAQVWGAMNGYVAGAGGAAAVGYVLQDSQTDGNQSQTFGLEEGRIWASTPFAAGATYELRRIELDLKKVGSAAGTVTCEIWSTANTAGQPNTQIAVASATINASALGTSYGTYAQFNFAAGTTLNSGTVYAIVIKRSEYNASAGVAIQYKDPVSGKSLYTTDNDPVSWGALNSNVRGNFKTYSCEVGGCS